MDNREQVFRWEYTKNGGVRILCGYGASPYVMIPEQIEGVPVTEIGAYCFSDFPKMNTKSEIGSSDTAENISGIKKPWMRELSGKYIQKVKLPDSVEKLGNLAFYNCSGLEELHFGRDLVEVGSDAFMNCLHLKLLVLQCGIREKSGLKQILSQRAFDTQVVFQREGITEGALFYPEYYEMYDEVGPAHIFALNLTGEGFRARQCFQDGIVDLGKYDGIFEQACVEESPETLSKMALNRLRYPVGLSVQARTRYQSYVQGQAEWIITELVKTKQLDLLTFLFQEKNLSSQWLDRSIQIASSQGWPEGGASLLRLKQNFSGGAGKERYSFDSF